jgi:hypothetical protein
MNFAPPPNGRVKEQIYTSTISFYQTSPVISWLIADTTCALGYEVGMQQSKKNKKPLQKIHIYSTGTHAARAAIAPGRPRRIAGTVHNPRVIVPAARRTAPLPAASII